MLVNSSKKIYSTDIDRRQSPNWVKKRKWKKEKGSGPSTFISKTFEILQTHLYDEIIAWNSEGTNFMICDVERFEQEILPTFFRHRNFSSFVRQLNMYDFHKIRNEQNKNIFEHKEFRRGCQDCLDRIKRKGCITRKTLDDKSQPYEQQSQEDQSFHPKTESRIRNTVEHLSKTQISPESKICSKKTIQVATQQVISSPEKKLLMEEFVSNVPETIQNENQFEAILHNLKTDDKYRYLNNREDLKKIIKRMKKRVEVREEGDDLEDLSIEQEIMMDHYEQQEHHNPTLANFSTEKYLPARSISIIGSFNIFEDITHLIYPRFH